MDDEKNDNDLQPLFSDINYSRYYISTSNYLIYHPRYRKDRVHYDTNNKLFADDIWPGSFVLSDYLCENHELIQNKTVLEFGAGFSLPSMVCSSLGASLVTISDYPEESILINIENLMKENNLLNWVVIGYCWGNEINELMQANKYHKYDLIILAELLWKDTYHLHELLLQAVTQCMKSDGIALLSFAHRSTLSHLPLHDMEFLQKAEKIYSLRYVLIEKNSKYKDIGENEPCQVMLYKLFFS
jgi:predicted nicotinamide N-methyase